MVGIQPTGQALTKALESKNLESKFLKPGYAWTVFIHSWHFNIFIYIFHLTSLTPASHAEICRVNGRSGWSCTHCQTPTPWPRQCPSLIYTHAITGWWKWWVAQACAVISANQTLFAAHFKLCILIALYSQHAHMCRCLCACVHACVCLYALRIASKDKILHFINTLIIIMRLCIFFYCNVNRLV